MFGAGKDDANADAPVWHSVWTPHEEHMLWHRTYRSTVKHFELENETKKMNDVMRFKPSESAEVRARSWDFEQRFLASCDKKK